MALDYSRHKFRRVQSFVMRKMVVCDLKRPGGEMIFDDDGFERLYWKAKDYAKTFRKS